MTSKQAIERMKRFILSHKGEKVIFCDLDAESKFDYVLVCQFNYHLPIAGRREAIQRAIRNAEIHKRDEYSIYEKKTMTVI